MPSTITLKRKITSIKGTRQITKAMQLVSASKLRRAQEQATRSREYRDVAYDLLQRLNAIQEVERQPLFSRRDVKNRLYIVLTSNTGLAGAYNYNVLKQLNKGLLEDKRNSVGSHAIVVGTKGAQFARRISTLDLQAVYQPFGDKPSANDIRPILNSAIQQFKDSAIDEVRVVYTSFKSTVSQEARSLQLLPAPKIDGASTNPPITTFEPDIETVIEQVTTRLVEAQVWQGVLESLASEHAMRMLATKNATDNANDLIDDYTLELNTARQAAITQELAEISGGSEALNG